MHFLKGLLFFIVIIIVIAVLILGYLGFVPGLSDIMGTNKPRDLGIKYTQADYDSAGAKNGVKIQVIDSAPDIKTSMVCKGSHQVNASFTSEELTARININSANWKYFPVKNVQIKINQDGTGEGSGLLLINRLAGFAQATGFADLDIKSVTSKLKFLRNQVPFYVKLGVTVKDGQAKLDVQKAELGRLGLPQDLATKYQSDINYNISRLLSAAAFSGLSVTSADLNGGKLNFNGKLPDILTTAKEVTGM